MTNKFKVGDVVKAIDNRYNCTTLDNEWQGVVTTVFADSGNFDADTTFFDFGKHAPILDLGETFKYLDPEHFELVPPKLKKSERITNAEQAISVLDSEVGTIKMRLDEYESLVGRVSALEEKQAETVEIKAGDFVKNTGKGRTYLTIGRAYEVVDVDSFGSYLINDDFGSRSFLDPHQCEKVAKPAQYSVGDVVLINGEVRVIIFRDNSKFPLRSVRVGGAYEELVPRRDSVLRVERYATEEEIENV